MRIVLDGLALPDADTLAHAIQRVAEESQRRARTIASLTLDGEPLCDDRLTPDLLGRAEGELSAISASPAELIDAALADASALLTDLRRRQDEAGRLVQQGKADEVISNLGPMLSDWQTIQATVQTSMRFDGWSGAAATSVSEHATSLARALTEVRSAISVDDPCELGDALRYGLTAEADRWSLLMGELRQTLASLRTEP